MSSNPAAPPSGTTLRFVSLIAVAVTLQVFGLYASAWPAATVLDDATCQVRSGLYFTPAHVIDPDEHRWSAYRDCMSGFLWTRAIWLAVGLVLLFGVAVVIYLVRPGWRVRRSRLVPLDGPLAAELRDRSTSWFAAPDCARPPSSSSTPPARARAVSRSDTTDARSSASTRAWSRCTGATRARSRPSSCMNSRTCGQT